MSRPSQRARILAAAAEVVSTHGAGTLTLDSAANQADVSKGGLLYHFPTKAALVAALIDGELDEYEAVIEARAVKQPGPAAWTRAYIDTTFDNDVTSPQVSAALLTSAEVDGTILERCAVRFGLWNDRIVRDGMSTGTAALIRFAADGWWTYAVIYAERPSRDSELLRGRLHGLVDAELQGS